jgi:hypothetical protein
MTTPDWCSSDTHGGLISRYYAEVLDRWVLTRKAVTIGTPYQGAKALGVLARGTVPFGKLKVDLRKVTRSLPSLAEVLPTYPCLGTSIDDLRQITAASDAPGLPDHCLARALDFQQRIREAVTENENEGRRRRYRALLSHRHSTDLWASVDQVDLIVDGIVVGDTETLRIHAASGLDDAGDGTVPRLSATPPEWDEDDESTVFLTGRHACLQQDSRTITQLVGILTGRPPRVTQAGPEEELAVDVPEAVQPDTAWEVQARAVSGNPRLSLEFVVEGPVKTEPGPSPRADRQPPALTTALASKTDGLYREQARGLRDPGIYRWTVRSGPFATSLVPPVSDLILCVDD